MHPAAVAALPRGADEDLPENAKPNALRLSLAGVQFEFQKTVPFLTKAPAHIIC